jgi:hypothetical protein
MVSCCNNVFGRHCLEIWLKSNNSCPLCRAELFPVNAAADRLAAIIQAAITTAVRRTVDQYFLEELEHRHNSEDQEQEEEFDASNWVAETLYELHGGDVQNGGTVGTVQNHQAQLVQQQLMTQRTQEQAAAALARHDAEALDAANVQQPYESLRLHIEEMNQLVLQAEALERGEDEDLDRLDAEALDLLRAQALDWGGDEWWSAVMGDDGNAPS